MSSQELYFEATPRSGKVSAIYLRPPGATGLYVFGHGAGAGMRHPFMERAAQGLAVQKIATFRYQFPYMEQGKKPPSPGPVLRDTVRAAIAEARGLSGGLPLFAGGKSMGGRMTSLAQAKEAIEGLQGLVFWGFPLHPGGKSGIERGEHLKDVKLPMLFLQGTRDRLAKLDHLEPLCREIVPQPQIHIIPDGDHSFGVLKRTGRSAEEVMGELCHITAAWINRCLS